MNYIVVAYSIVLIISIYFGYKKNLGVSILSIFISSSLCIVTLLNLFHVNNYFNILISFFLIILSVSLFYDRKRSGKKINYHHHLIRFTIHALLIYYLLLG